MDEKLLHQIRDLVAQLTEGTGVFTYRRPDGGWYSAISPNTLLASVVCMSAMQVATTLRPVAYERPTQSGQMILEMESLFSTTLRVNMWQGPEAQGSLH